VARAEGYLKNLKILETGPDKRAEWEKFLTAWQSAVDKLVTYALSEDATRPLGNKIRSLNQRGDPAIAYCRVSRNATSHGLVPAVKMIGSSTRLVGNSVVISGDSALTIGTFHSNGRLVGKNVEVETSEGVPSKVRGMKSPDDVSHHYVSIELADFVMEKRGKQHSRPSELNGEPLAPSDLQSLGTYALGWLKDYLTMVQDAL